GIQEIGGPRVCECLWRAAVMGVGNSQQQRWTKCSRERVEDSRNSRVRQSVVPGDRGQRSDAASPALAEDERRFGMAATASERLCGHEQRRERITSDGDKDGGAQCGRVGVVSWVRCSGRAGRRSGPEEEAA
ncbi:hypothetical protein JI435_408240, partial [Parastagonospora nodorum SN15]